MGLLTEFYVSINGSAARYDEERAAVETEVLRTRGVGPLELTTLWAILLGMPWDESMLDEVAPILIRDDGERMIHRLPDVLVERLAKAGTQQLREAAAAWADTEEMACNAEDVEPLLDDLQRLAQAAVGSGRAVFLWNCV